MFDISPEKLLVLLAAGMIVLGPDKLPGAARGLARNLARARRVAASLTNPITTTIAEPVRAAITEVVETSLAKPGAATPAGHRTDP